MGLMIKRSTWRVWKGILKNDTKIQNDSQAVLIKVSDNCSKIENLMHAGLKATQAVAEKAKRAEPDNTAKDIDDNKKPSKKEYKDNLGSPNTPVEDDTFRQHQVTWIGTRKRRMLKSKSVQ